MQTHSRPTTQVNIGAIEQPLLLNIPLLEKHMQPKQYHPCSVTFTTLALALKAKDLQLYKHSYRVYQFASHLTSALHLSEYEATTIKLAALFHDIGKLAIDNQILHKVSSLTRQERDKLREHPRYGALILSQIKLLNKVAPLVYYHHERWDGNGYPDGLRGEMIPLGARIITIADAFDAITSPRAYKTACTPMKGLEELLRCADTQFDPKLVDIFCTWKELIR